MIGWQSTKTSTQGATPTRILLFLPRRIRAPSGAVRWTPISLCRLPTGTTTRELVTSDRSVEISLCRQPLSAPANMARTATLIRSRIHRHSRTRCVCPARCEADVVLEVDRTAPGWRLGYFVSEPYCFKNAMTLTISSSLLRPGNSIFVPGTLALGFLRYSWSVASSQMRPEFVFASE